MGLQPVASKVQWNTPRLGSIVSLSPQATLSGGNSASLQRSSAPQAGKLPLWYIISPVLIKLFPRMKDSEVNGPAPRPGCGLAGFHPWCGRCYRSRWPALAISIWAFPGVLRPSTAAVTWSFSCSKQSPKITVSMSQCPEWSYYPTVYLAQCPRKQKTPEKLTSRMYNSGGRRWQPPQ